MRKAIILLVLFLGMSGCGDDIAPHDAQVIGPLDATITVPPSDPRTQSFILDFQVLDKAGIVALPEVDIEFFSSGGVLTGAATTNPTYLKTKTDPRGSARAIFSITFPACGTADQAITGNVTGTLVVANHVWTGTFTVKQC